jgi:hypothetical protein
MEKSSIMGWTFRVMNRACITWDATKSWAKNDPPTIKHPLFLTNGILFFLYILCRFMINIINRWYDNRWSSIIRIL